MHRERVEAAYRAHHPVLWRALYAFTGDREVANDAEAEAFTQALRRDDRIDDVAAWVWRSAFKIASGMLGRRRHAVPLDEAAGTDGNGSLSDFLGLLGDLSVQQRACVVLRHVGDFTTPQIAELLGTTPGTVRVQLHRAHESLRSALSVDREVR